MSEKGNPGVKNIDAEQLGVVYTKTKKFIHESTDYLATFRSSLVQVKDACALQGGDGDTVVALIEALFHMCNQLEESHKLIERSVIDRIDKAEVLKHRDQSGVDAVGNVTRIVANNKGQKR